MGRLRLLERGLGVGDRRVVGCGGRAVHEVLLDPHDAIVEVGEGLDDRLVPGVALLGRGEPRPGGGEVALGGSVVEAEVDGSVVVGRVRGGLGVRGDELGLVGQVAQALEVDLDLGQLVGPGVVRVGERLVLVEPVQAELQDVVPVVAEPPGPHADPLERGDEPVEGGVAVVALPVRGQPCGERGVVEGPEGVDRLDPGGQQDLPAVDPGPLEVGLQLGALELAVEAALEAAVLGLRGDQLAAGVAQLLGPGRVVDRSVPRGDRVQVGAEPEAVQQLVLGGARLGQPRLGPGPTEAGLLERVGGREQLGVHHVQLAAVGLAPVRRTRRLQGPDLGLGCLESAGRRVQVRGAGRLVRGELLELAAQVVDPVRDGDGRDGGDEAVGAVAAAYGVDRIPDVGGVEDDRRRQLAPQLGGAGLEEGATLADRPGRGRRAVDRSSVDRSPVVLRPPVVRSALRCAGVGCAGVGCVAAGLDRRGLVPCLGVDAEGCEVGPGLADLLLGPQVEALGHPGPLGAQVGQLGGDPVGVHGPRRAGRVEAPLGLHHRPGRRCGRAGQGGDLGLGLGQCGLELPEADLAVLDPGRRMAGVVGLVLR